MNFDEFSKQFVKSQSNDYYRRFWANTAYSNGLTIRFDNKELLVKPEDISMVDLGDICGQCKCGHAIRYEYWFDTIGPIGSTCISTMTGLSGQDLRTIIRGGNEARKDKDELLRFKEHYGTLGKQLKQDKILAERIKYLDERGMVPEVVQKFIESDIPIPNNVSRIVNSQYWKDFKENDLIVKYGKQVVDCLQVAEELAVQAERLINGHVNLLVDGSKPIYTNIRDIANKLRTGSPSEKAINLFVKLINNVKNPKFIDALDVLVKLQANKGDVGEFWHKVINESLTNAIKFGLSEKQIEFVLDKSGTGKPGLAVRFSKYLQPMEDVKEDTVSHMITRMEVQTEKIDKQIERSEGDDTAFENPEGIEDNQKPLLSGENPW